MTWFRLPLSVWSLFITAILGLLALPVLSGAVIMLLFDQTIGTHFFVPVAGGQALLWQHLFWFFGHPEVYILILPAMGMASDIIANGSRTPIFGYHSMVFAIIGIAFLGWIVWGHHMFMSGMNPTLGSTFMVSTLLIAVPSAIKVFNWLGTIWRGNIRFHVPMLNALGFVSMFTIGGLSGIFMAATPVDIQLHDTQFIVAHIHYVLFGGSLFALFAAITYWYPKMFGRMMSERIGTVHFWLTFIFYNMTFFPMHIIGMGGQMRRIYDPTIYTFLKPQQPLNVFISYSAFALFAVQILFAFNFLWSLTFGKKAPQNPWDDNGMEWSLPNPAPHGNWERTPNVYRGPYEFSAPEAGEKDFLPQYLKLPTDRDPVPAPLPAGHCPGECDDARDASPRSDAAAIPGRAGRRGLQQQARDVGLPGQRRDVLHGADRIVHRAPLWCAGRVGQAGRGVERPADRGEHLPAHLLVRLDGEGVRRDSGRQEILPAPGAGEVPPRRRAEVLAAGDDALRRGVRERAGRRIHQARRARFHARRLPRRLDARRACRGGSDQIRCDRRGTVRFLVLHDDGVPRFPRDVRRDQHDGPVLHQGAAGGAVLHASEVRALAPAPDLHRPIAARRDPRDRGHHGEGLVALLELTKPRITQLVLLTAAAGFYLGAEDRVDLLLLANTLIGTALVAGGTNAWNQIRERDVGSRMARTRRRPLPSGRLTTRAAIWFASAITAGGVADLCVAGKVLTAAPAPLAFPSYVLLSTPLQ